MVSRDFSEKKSSSALRAVHLRIDYNLEIFKVVLTNITKVKIRYSEKNIKFCLQLVLFLELLLKIPDGLSIP